jgi:uncharacterized protein (TIGR03118 family)
LAVTRAGTALSPQNQKTAGDTKPRVVRRIEATREVRDNHKELAMRNIGVWALGLAAAVGGMACADQGPSSDGTTTQAGAGVLLESVKLDPRSRIEGEVQQVNLITDSMKANQAAHADPTLLNPWGLAFFPQGPAWISANGNGTLNVYDGNGNPARDEVTIPPTAPTGATPDGLVFNPNPKDFRGDTFIAVTEDGDVIGWKGSDGDTATVRLNNAPAVYKGVTVGEANGRPHLYAADFHDGVVAVFDADYHRARLPGSFTDPRLPSGFAPFNLIDAGPFLLVSYAKQDDDRHDDVAALGNGFLDVFTTEGFFVQRLISQGQLDSPWAMLFAPDRDRASIDLLVGNFGNGRINVYDLSVRHGGLRADFEGALGDSAGNPIFIDGLWALAFGSGGANFDASKIYFTAGPNGESDGLFGSLTFTGPRR